MDPSRLEELVNEAAQHEQGGTGRRWTDRLSDDALAYLRYWEERVRDGGNPPNYRTFVGQLKREFGVKVSPSTVGNHFNRIIEEAESGR